MKSNNVVKIIDDKKFSHACGDDSYVSLGDFYDQYPYLINKKLLEETDILYSVPYNCDDSDDWEILIVNNPYNTYILHNRSEIALPQVYKLKGDNIYDYKLKQNITMCSLMSLLYIIPNSINIEFKNQIEYESIYNLLKNKKYENSSIEYTNIASKPKFNISLFANPLTTDKYLSTIITNTDVNEGNSLLCNIIMFFYDENIFKDNDSFYFILYNQGCKEYKRLEDGKYELIQKEIFEKEEKDKYMYLSDWSKWNKNIDDLILKYSNQSTTFAQIFDLIKLEHNDLIEKLEKENMLDHFFCRLYLITLLNKQLLLSELNICQIPHIYDIKKYIFTSSIQEILLNYFKELSQYYYQISILLDDRYSITNHNCNCIYHQFMKNIWNYPSIAINSLSHSLTVTNQSYQIIQSSILYEALNHSNLFTNRNSKYLPLNNACSTRLRYEYYGIGILLAMLFESLDFDMFNYFPTYFWKLLFYDDIKIDDIDEDIIANSKNNDNKGIYQTYIKLLCNNNNQEKLSSEELFISNHYCYDISMNYIRNGLLAIIPYSFFKLLSYDYVKSLQQ